MPNYIFSKYPNSTQILHMLVHIPVPMVLLTQVTIVKGTNPHLFMHISGVTFVSCKDDVKCKAHLIVLNLTKTA